MKRSPRIRQTSVNLSESISRQLNMYAIAASAAGVGILALAQPAYARIVYTHVDRAFGQQGLAIDLNHDGIADFRLQLRTVYADWQFVLASSLRSNRVFGAGSHGDSASHLRAGYCIGRNGAKFQEGGFFSSYKFGPAKILSYAHIQGSGTAYGGPWVKAKFGYLGFKFLIKGKFHYGWARIHHDLQLKTWRLTGYAYETIPNKPIIAGQTEGPDDFGNGAPDAALTTPTSRPATLGALAMGAPGLSIWPRKKSSLDGQ